MALPRHSSKEVYVNAYHIERSRSARPQSWLDSFIQSGDGTAMIQQKRLHRVPNMLLKTKDHQNFRPTVVSIGPYHHGSEEFRQAEALKPAIAKEFLSGKDKSIAAVFSTFEEEIIQTKVFDQECRKGILQDIHKFIKQNTGTLERLGKPPLIEKSSDLGSNNSSAEPPLHLLEMLRAEIVGRRVDKPERSEGGEEIGYSLRGVKELMDVGITFQPSHTSSLGDVRFESHSIYGELFLPPFHIDDSTGRKLLNIITYEMCPEGPLDPEVISYICFFDLLVDKAGDVKELRAAGIIHNFIANDEEVVKFLAILLRIWCQTLIHIQEFRNMCKGTVIIKERSGWLN